jgi:alpha-N-acetylglucosamine transferase
VLHRSLKETNSKYPLYVAVTEEVSKENLAVLEKLAIPIIYFDLVIPPNMTAAESPNIVTTLDFYGWHKALCKLRVFGLEQFDKVVFIDADVIVKNNMDELFDLPHLSACRDCYDFYGQFGDTPSLNSGLLVIEPDVTVATNILDFLTKFDAQGKLVHDQWIIQEYYKGWEACTDLHLSYYYCPWTTRFDINYPQYYYHRHLIKAVHMIDMKPWRVNRQYFIDLMPTYYLYSILNLDYIDILNFTIQDLACQGITSSDLKVIY